MMRSNLGHLITLLNHNYLWCFHWCPPSHCIICLMCRYHSRRWKLLSKSTICQKCCSFNIKIFIFAVVNIGGSIGHPSLIGMLNRSLNISSSPSKISQQWFLWDSEIVDWKKNETILIWSKRLGSEVQIVLFILGVIPLT
jgi:hypothetical protein